MIRNALVLGSGRSGTSLLAGLFNAGGYFSGENLWPATISNPLGYFEDIEINGINEDLLKKVAPWRPRGIAGTLLPIFHDRPKWSQRWLITLPAGTAICSDPALDRRIVAQVSRRPYLFKDPRFSYTLPAWVPHLSGDTTFLCTFREPLRTVNSIMKIVRDERYLRDIRMTRDRAIYYWTALYSNILYLRERIAGEWLFVHYDELLSRRAIPILEARLGVRADITMIRSDLNRSAMDSPVTPSVDNLYSTLVELAELKYR